MRTQKGQKRPYNGSSGYSMLKLKWLPWKLYNTLCSSAMHALFKVSDFVHFSFYIIMYFYASIEIAIIFVTSSIVFKWFR